MGVDIGIAVDAGVGVGASIAVRVGFETVVGGKNVGVGTAVRVVADSAAAVGIAMGLGGMVGAPVEVAVAGVAGWDGAPWHAASSKVAPAAIRPNARLLIPIMRPTFDLG